MRGVRTSKPALTAHGLEDFDLVGEALGLTGVGPVVAALPGLVGANERPSCQREVERKGSGNAMRQLNGQALEIAGLPAEPRS